MGKLLDKVITEGFCGIHVGWARVRAALGRVLRSLV